MTIMRDVIAEAVMEFINDEDWMEPHTGADRILAALEAAGLKVVKEASEPITFCSKCGRDYEITQEIWDATNGVKP